MLHAIIGFAVRNKLIIALFIIGLIGYGSYQVTRLPIDAVPDITNNQVQVITIAPSYGATDIERLVTFPIEQANNNIQGIKEIRSFSRFGLSLVTIVFDDATDIYWARQQVSERLQRVAAQIPHDIGLPELGPVTTGLGEIYQYVLRPEKGYEQQYSAMELRTIQDWIVRRQLLGVKGVAEVSSFGGHLKQYSVDTDPRRLLANGVTIDELFKALAANNQNTGGAYIEKSATTLFIRTEGLLSGIEDIRQTPVKFLADGSPVFVKDVADVTIGHATRFGAMCYNDEGEVAGAVVMMLKGANSNDVIKNVKERILQIQKTLPKGVVIEAFLDRTKMVNNAIGTVEKNLAEGALIVLFVLVIFLGSIRAGVLVASVIPLSMLFAVILMNLFGVSGNLMSLGALDFGLIVDGAVIIVEAVMHRLSHSKHFAHIQKLNPGEMDGEVKQYAGNMMNSAVFGQVIILVVYLPIFSLEGIEGKMFKPMAQTVAFALLGAFVLSLTYIPMMSALVLSRKIKHQPNFADRFMARIERVYQHWLIKVLQVPKTVLATVLALMAVAMFTLSRMGGEFIPSLEEGDFAVDTRVLTGSSLTTTIQQTQKAAHILKSRFPEVEKIVTKIGSGEVPTDPMPMEASDMMVILKDKKDWVSAKSFDELAEKMGEALRDIPGITAGFQYPVQMRFNELMTGARQDVVCKIFGEDLDTLSHYARQMGHLAHTVEGTRNLYVEPVDGIPQIVVRFNRQAIAQYGVNIQDINRVINTAFAGQFAGIVNEGEKRFDLVVRMSPEIKNSIDDVRQLLIPAKETQVPLYLLARVDIIEGPNQIQREDARRRIVVGFNVSGRDVESIVNELREKAENQLNLPPGYYVTYGGAFENLKAAKDRLMIAVPVSLLLIYLLLYFAFRSVKMGLLIFSAIPLSAIGGILLLAACGMPFSISAGVGFIALFGVSVLNGIVLIAEFRRQQADGLKDLQRVVVMGTKVRLRPVLMTAAVASLGFLPMALSNGAGAEVQRPLATVVIGGLITATFLTLFVLPILFIMFQKEKRPGKRKQKKVVSTLGAFILLGSCSLIHAQTGISLQDALDSAVKNNAAVQVDIAREAYLQQQTRTIPSIPRTSFTTEAGQLNSAYLDTRISVSQAIPFPSIYKTQLAVQKAEYEKGKLQTSLKKYDIRQQVALLYYELLYLDAKKRLLEESDTIFRAFYQKANLRFVQGESDVLDKTAAENQLNQIYLQLQMLETDRQSAALSWQWLLRSTQLLWPMGNLTDSLFNPSGLSLKADVHPLLKLDEQEVKIAKASIEAEKAKRIPDMVVGYANTSFRGIGADDKLYSASSRFHAVQIGLSASIFGRIQKEKVQAAMLAKTIAERQLSADSLSIHHQQQQLRASVNRLSESVRRLQQKTLPGAATLRSAADTQYLNGAINYLQWAQLTHQQLQMQSDYLDLLFKLKTAAVQLHFLTTQSSL